MALQINHNIIIVGLHNEALPFLGLSTNAVDNIFTTMKILYCIIVVVVLRLKGKEEPYKITLCGGAAARGEEAGNGTQSKQFVLPLVSPWTKAFDPQTSYPAPPRPRPVRPAFRRRFHLQRNTSPCFNSGCTIAPRRSASAAAALRCDDRNMSCFPKSVRRPIVATDGRYDQEIYNCKRIQWVTY